MSCSTLQVKLAERSYDIVITHRDPGGIGPFARQRVRGEKAFVVSDVNVASQTKAVASEMSAAGFQTEMGIRPSGEEQKSLAVAAELYDALVAFHADRRTMIVAVGGGVVGDLAGFVAATFNRGLPLLMVPTTLLAMVDSSVGGKVAVNHPRGKNLIGVFHQPIGVWIDTAALESLPDREYRSGLAEVVKYGVILDSALFAYLENNISAVLERRPDTLHHIISRCCRLKADIVEADEREETGRRAILNYGHTFAHAFETAAGYGSWLHGEAVAAGTICASRLAERLGMISPEVTDRQRRLLQAFGLPTTPEAWPCERLLETMRSDKKALAGKLRFVLPRKLGEAALFENVRDEDVVAVLQSPN